MENGSKAAMAHGAEGQHTTDQRSGKRLHVAWPWQNAKQMQETDGVGLTGSCFLELNLLFSFPSALQKYSLIRVIPTVAVYSADD